MTSARFFIQAALLLALLSSPFNVVEVGDKKGDKKGLKGPKVPKPNRKQRKVDAKEKAVKFANMKAAGQDQVSMTKEAAELRSYELRKKSARDC